MQIFNLREILQDAPWQTEIVSELIEVLCVWSCSALGTPPALGLVTHGGSDPLCVSPPDRSRGCPGAWEQSMEGTHCSTESQQSIQANGKCWKGLVKAIYSLFPKAFVCVASSVEHPGGTCSVGVFYQCSGLGIYDCIGHLWGTKEVWGYSRDLARSSPE